MKFYIYGNDRNGVQGCSFSLEVAKQQVRKLRETPVEPGASGGEYIDQVTIETTSLREVVRLLLGARGGYADDVKRVFEA